MKTKMIFFTNIIIKLLCKKLFNFIASVGQTETKKISMKTIKKEY